MGDGFLMTQGFTLLWVGWQFDPPQREGLVRVYAPVATDNGKPIMGIVRSEVIVAKVAFDASLADRDHIAYTVANPDDPANTLTVRDTIEGAAPVHPEERMETGRRPRVSGRRLPAGEDLRSGLQVAESAGGRRGPAAVRDAISHLKYAPPLAGDRCRFPQARFSARLRSACRRAGAFCERISITDSTKTSATARCSTA